MAEAGQTPNTPNNYPLVDQPNTPAIEANAQVLRSGDLPSQFGVPQGGPALERTNAEVEAGRKAVSMHQEQADKLRSTQEEQAKEEADTAQEDAQLHDGTPLVRDPHADMTPVTLEDGSQARVPRRVADAARAEDHGRSADLGTGKFPRSVDPRDPAVREEETNPDVDRNTPKGPVSAGVRRK
jgi:hypothetical protein